MRGWWFILAAVGCSLPSSEARTVESEAAASATARPPQPPACGETLPTIAEQTVESVVNVFTERRRRQPSSFRPFLDAPHSPSDQALGSGVVIDRSGIIVTNHHVVEEATAIRVALHDGTTLDAERIGSDPNSDLAVLRLTDPPDDLVALDWGPSRDPRLGETVLAVGNPFGMGHSVTRGIVSAKGRAQVGIVDYEDFIQTDAAINPGNSGGALVDTRGRLVGINTAILSRSGGHQGIGLAIPAHLAERVVADLLEDGKTDRGWLGVSIQEITEDLKLSLELPDRKGVLIASVEPGSAADHAGIEAGDVVRIFDGETVDSPSSFRNQVALAGPDHRFTATILRRGRERTLRGTLAAHPGQAASDTSGLTLVEDDEGLVVQDVRSGSIGQRAGLRPGDRILQIQGKSATMTRWSQVEGDERILLLIERNGLRRFTVLAGR